MPRNKSNLWHFPQNPILLYSDGGSLIPLMLNASGDIVDELTPEMKDRINVGEQTAIGALKGAGTGAQIGSIFGPIGTAIGAGVGGIGGGVISNIASKKQRDDLHENLMERFHGENAVSYPWAGGTTFENGGVLPGQDMTKDFNEFNGNKHEMGGIPLGKNAEVEDGETRYKDYIFSDNIKPKNGRYTFADLSRKIYKKYKDRPDDHAANLALNKELETLMIQNEVVKKEKEKENSDALTELTEVEEFGEDVQFKGGGFYINPKKKAMFESRAFDRGLSTDEFAKRVYDNNIKFKNGGYKKYADGGFLNKEGNKVVQDNEMYSSFDPNFGFMMGDAVLPEFKDPIATKRLDVPSNEDLPRRTIETDEFKNPNIFSRIGSHLNNFAENLPETNFQNEEKGFLASVIPGISNVISGITPENTEFTRVKPEEIDLSDQRLLAERSAQRAKNINRESLRGSGRSSGEILSRMAASNSAIQEAMMDNFLQTYVQEETTNTQINNRANEYNNNLSIQEIIANEQNDANARLISNTGLSNIATNYQGYIKDKGLARENAAYNERIQSVINQIFPNYKFGTDPETDKMIIQFINVKNGG